MRLRRILLLTVALVLGANGLAGAAGKPAYKYDSNVPVSWYFLLYDRVRAENLSPPVAARVFGATGIALYQAVQGGMQRNLSLVGQLNQLDLLPTADGGQRYHWPSAANAALAEVLRSLFAGKPNSLADFNNRETQFERSFENSSPGNTVSGPVLKRSSALGRAIGRAVAAWIGGDRFAKVYNSPFTPPA